MIAIIGKTAVGKTFILEKANSLGYSTLNCDKFFENEYKKNNKCYEIIKNNLGKDYVNDFNVNKTMLKSFISTKNGRTILEKLIYPVLFDHLNKIKYDFVEIPILFNSNCDFTIFFNKILNITASFERRTKNLKFKNVDKYDLKFFDTINIGYFGIDAVDINMDKLAKNTCWKIFFKTHYIKII